MRSPCGSSSIISGKQQDFRNVTLQVLPTGRGDEFALDGSLILLETAEGEQYGYVESSETSVLYAESAKVNALSMRYGMIRSQALSMEESAEFIRAMAEER
ncbi:Scr1 family TA system antitoxin-like transcriptional regulator [Streptomyces uncialis]|uniref:Scr1 family TA system antitoxin-like transcriptional regulator n=1 Tax=Streptomyces uncialis TaxID=1048205 RepID=UPI00365890DA